MPNIRNGKAKSTPNPDLQIDQAMDALVERVAERLKNAKEIVRESPNRLIQLDEFHYFDTQDKVLLLKDGAQYKNLNCNPVYLRRSVERIREDAKKNGSLPIEGGSFWNPTTKHLYIINGERYVLYGLDRRKSTRTRRAGDQ